MQKTHSVDLIIVGGGIAGLWTLAVAKKRGLNAILFEKNQLGCGQSIASQGIIHGGSKYALAGIISQAASNISQMPSLWQQALNGQGEVDLRQAKVLSNAQYLIPASGIDSKLLSFLGSKTMASFTETVKAKHLPTSYQSLGIKRSSFKLNEMVLDTRSVFQCLLQQFQDCIYQVEISSDAIEQTADCVRIHLPKLILEADNLVIAAGNGNQSLPTGPMQQRPLQMVAMYADNLPAIYAHFIGRSNKPLLTITSHPHKQAHVWYMGGNLAENGVDLSSDEQIQQARDLLSRLLPKFELSQQTQFDTVAINRAEPKQSSLLRPDDAYVKKQGRIISGWPTKLALAPRFAEQALTLLNSNSSQKTKPKLELKTAAIANYPWSFS